MLGAASSSFGAHDGSPGEIGRAGVAHLRDIVNMIAHGNEEVEEHLCATGLHFHLHCARALEGLAAADDQCEVMSTET